MKIKPSHEAGRLPSLLHPGQLRGTPGDSGSKNRELEVKIILENSRGLIMVGVAEGKFDIAFAGQQPMTVDTNGAGFKKLLKPLVDNENF